MAVPDINKKATKQQLIKSKERVRDLAEVYTAEREVRAMLDLIPNFSFKQTYLEPACGNGNFLVEILRRKLQSHPTTKSYFTLNKQGKIPPFPRGGKAEEVALVALEAVSTLYGFDICANNIAETQARLYAYVLYGEDLLLPGFLTGKDEFAQTFLEEISPGGQLRIVHDYEERLFKVADKMGQHKKIQYRAKTVSSLLREALRLVLLKNFQQGDFLSQKNFQGDSLIVGRWGFLSGKIRREDFLLSDVGSDNPTPINVLSLRSLTEFVAGDDNA